MKLFFLGTVDIDNDGVAGDNERTRLSWTGIGAVPAIKHVFMEYGARVSWFIRADNQLLDLYGTAAYLLEQHAPLWQSLAATGDDLCWHPHLYRRNRSDHTYEADHDAGRCAAQLRSIHAELRLRGFAFDAVRIGEAFHGNPMMHALSDLGLKVDATAIPGRRRHDAARVMDWENTPNAPYYPSAHDYRVPDPASSLPILEVPMTTIPIRAPYDPGPLIRYINPSYHNALLIEGFETYLDALLHTDLAYAFVTLILHPDEVDATRRTHPLYSFSLDVVRQNLHDMTSAVARRGFDVAFITMSDVVECFRQESGARTQ